MKFFTANHTTYVVNEKEHTLTVDGIGVRHYKKGFTPIIRMGKPVVFVFPHGALKTGPVESIYEC